MGNHDNKLLKVRLFSTIMALQKLLVKFTLQPQSIDSLLSGVMHASTNSNLVAPTQAVVNKFTEVLFFLESAMTSIMEMLLMAQQLLD